MHLADDVIKAGRPQNFGERRMRRRPVEEIVHPRMPGNALFADDVGSGRWREAKGVGRQRRIALEMREAQGRGLAKRIL